MTGGRMTSIAAEMSQYARVGQHQSSLSSVTMVRSTCHVSHGLRGGGRPIHLMFRLLLVSAGLLKVMAGPVPVTTDLLPDTTLPPPVTARLVPDTARPAPETACTLEEYKILTCRSLGMSQIPPNVYGKDITKFEFSQNKLYNLEKNAFKEFLTVLTLVLVDNQIFRMDLGAFLGLDELKHLSLRLNEISYLDPRIFRKNLKLTDLDISQNPWKLSRTPFLISHSLRILYMSQCNLPAVYPKTFARLYKLEKLVLIENNLTHLDNLFFAILPSSVLSVHLRHNPWNCDDDLKTLFQSNKHRIDRLESLVCFKSDNPASPQTMTEVTEYQTADTILKKDETPKLYENTTILHNDTKTFEAGRNAYNDEKDETQNLYENTTILHNDPKSFESGRKAYNDEKDETQNLYENKTILHNDPKANETSRKTYDVVDVNKSDDGTVSVSVIIGPIFLCCVLGGLVYFLHRKCHIGCARSYCPNDRRDECQEGMLGNESSDNVTSLVQSTCTVDEVTV